LICPELRPFLARMRLQAELRRALENRGYQEVQTSILLPAPPPDPEIEPFIANYLPGMAPEPPARETYPHTSPELEMKRLMARGLEAIYQIVPVFRQGELGRLHSPEFTMAEWYRAGWGSEKLMEEVEQVVAEVTGGAVMVAGKSVEARPPFARIAVEDAMAEAGVDAVGWDGLSAAEFKRNFGLAYLEKVEPWIEGQGAVFLVGFPAPLAQLAELNPRRPGMSSRFELIIGGVEIANGCAELTDTAELRRRFEEEIEERRQSGNPVHPMPEKFIADLAERGPPPCAGVALGVERLAMLVAGVDELSLVRARPFME